MCQRQRTSAVVGMMAAIDEDRCWIRSRPLQGHRMGEEKARQSVFVVPSRSVNPIFTLKSIKQGVNGSKPPVW
ncbi:hypothetical protein PsorP6_001468 [Peronosclerospora sorghi]|uniref:Uncharacterized protein n=1 Tax=Peronosclerospora sorghi TaxID=230839 RepID=A0ACC0WZD7_9STRA|nr:hypothetical protein PsorP6_001468 [Peronosclerospora sorghi]